MTAAASPAPQTVASAMCSRIRSVTGCSFCATDAILAGPIRHGTSATISRLASITVSRFRTAPRFEQGLSAYKGSGDADGGGAHLVHTGRNLTFMVPDSRLESGARKPDS